MEDLRTTVVTIWTGSEEADYIVHEKDHGDDIVYDIFKEDQYLMTLSRDGGILFMNFAADDSSREIFKLSSLHQFIERIEQLA